jgi:hypothetical protein
MIQSPQQPYEAERRKILNALNDQRFVWRTAAGIAKDTELDASLVTQILHSWTDEIVIPPYRSTSGEQLYGSRTRFIQQSTFSNSLSGVFNNRIY